jgi:hypothetical protein
MAVCIAPLPLLVELAELPEAVPLAPALCGAPVESDWFALISSLAGNALAVTPVLFLHELGKACWSSVNVTSAHCGWWSGI